MRRSHRVPLVLAGLALATLAGAGCAAISGLDGITELACAPDCDGGATSDSTVVGPDGTPPPGTTDSPTGGDATLAEDALPPTDDGPARIDSQPPPDAGEVGGDDSSTEAGGADAGTDASADASFHDAGHDAGTDAAGCGPLNTTANCSACGDTCTATNATSPTCNGTTCSYSCKPNFLDCNASSAPDLDGCECNATGGTAAPIPQCCGSICPLTHHYDLDLVNSTFYDCVAEGAFNQTLAMDACTAFTGSAGQCNVGAAPIGCTYLDGGNAGSIICSNGTGAPSCNCWGYSGDMEGWMSTGPGKGTANCTCPQPGGTQWN